MSNDAPLRGLDDPSLRGGHGTLLTLPASDFPGGVSGNGASGGANGSAGGANANGAGGGAGNDGLVLIRLSNGGRDGLTLDDLLGGAYVLGDDDSNGGGGRPVWS